MRWLAWTARVAIGLVLVVGAAAASDDTAASPAEPGDTTTGPAAAASDDTAASPAVDATAPTDPAADRSTPSPTCALLLAPDPADAEELAPVIARAIDLLPALGWTPDAPVAPADPTSPTASPHPAAWTLALNIGYSGAKTVLRLSLTRASPPVAVDVSSGASVYAMPDVLPRQLPRLFAAAADALAAADWRAGTPPRIEAGSLDVPLPDGGEVSLMPFAWDPEPVAAWRYDGCEREGPCTARSQPQPVGCPDAPAIGMRWEHAAAYCSALGLSVQSALQDSIIRDALPRGARGPHLIDADPTKLVTRGFRCVEVHD